METLKIAVQKSGRLKDDSMKLLKDIGVSIDNGKDQLKARASNFPIEVFFLRNGDIPQYLKDGVVDAAIIGNNVLVEKGPSIKSICNLGFSKCRVSIAVPKGMNYESLKDLQGKQENLAQFANPCLKPGDIIIKVDGWQHSSFSETVKALRSCISDSVELTFIRNSS